ncbi:hypothetical protein NPIL_72391 [Nephila pilipes]|uniref:Uncharacterized protein n=1 Tax=Nephila pilipes TaxID=299642 RepID=A0A8X6TQB7_NEPPI|nr:hypothetical protein NPIL_72391 [Nephila pilipes]
MSIPIMRNDMTLLPAQIAVRSLDRLPSGIAKRITLICHSSTNSKAASHYIHPEPADRNFSTLQETIQSQNSPQPIGNKNQYRQPITIHLPDSSCYREPVPSIFYHVSQK